MAKGSSKSLRIAEKTLYAALSTLKDAGGALPGREVLNQVEMKLELSDWAKESLDKSGYIRWQSILHFCTIDAAKAGFLRKQKGIWYITAEGEKALSLYDEKELLAKAQAAYRKWRKEHSFTGTEEIHEHLEKEEMVQLDQIEQSSKEIFRKHIRAKNPYEFQDMVAALLRAMGYFTPFVAPRGKDGGVDIFAYQDPLGTKTPRIKAQVKHKPDSNIPPSEVQQLIGTLGMDDVGIFVTTGSYTRDAQDLIRTANRHITLIDFDRFVDLWIEFYPKMDDEDKQLMPLKPIYFVAPDEE